MRTALGMLLLVGVGACLRPALVECGELACAPAQVCHDNRCLDPSQLAACDSVAEGSSCDALGEPGHCTDGVCEIATCGDGYVDDELREECDGSVPASHCIDFGYDIGRPACTACQPDETMGCSRFGWERIIDAPTIALWTDGDTFAYLTSTGLTVRTPAMTVVVPGDFAGVHGNAGRVIAYHLTSFVEVDIATGIPTKRTLPPIEHARVASDGTIFTLFGCVVSRLDMDRLVPIGPKIANSVCRRLEVGLPTASGPRIFVAAGPLLADRVYRWDPARGQFLAISSSTEEPGDEITDMRFHGDRVWVAATSEAFTVDDNNQREVLAAGSGFVSIAFSGGATLFGGSAGIVARVLGDRVQRFRAPGLITGDGAVYAYRGPIYRFTGTDYGVRTALSSQLEVVASFEDGDNVIVATKAALHVSTSNGAGWTQIPGPSAQTRAFAGAKDVFFLSAFDPPPLRQPKLFSASEGLGGFGSATSATWELVAVPMDALLYGLWWAEPDATLFAVGDNDAGDAFFGVRRGTTMWETAIRAGCAVRAVHGTDSSHVIAVGGCGTRAAVWSYDGTQWSELPRPDLAGPLLAGLRFANGMIVATGDSGTARFDGTTWTIDMDVTGSWVSGTSDSDIWVSGAFTSVQHFDGTVWSKLAVQANGPIAVTAAPDRVLFPGATEGFVELVR